jgi:hypothetical protein
MRPSRPTVVADRRLVRSIPPNHRDLDGSDFGIHRSFGLPHDLARHGEALALLAGEVAAMSRLSAEPK